MAKPQSVVSSVAAIKRKKAEIADLEAGIREARALELATLYRRYGFASPEAFILAVRKALRAGASKKPESSSKRRGKRFWGRRKQRVALTPQLKAQVAALLEQKTPLVGIAKQLHLSLSSVMKIKRGLQTRDGGAEPVAAETVSAVAAAAGTPQ